MPDTRRTWADFDAIFPDNTAGAISPQDLRDFLLTVQANQDTADPTVSDDGTLGYDVKSWWINTSTPSLWVCLDNSTGAAVWHKVFPLTASDVGAVPTGTSYDAIQQDVNQTAHGFAVGDVLRFDGSAWVKSLADTAAHAVVLGVVGAVIDADNFTLVLGGLVGGLSGLTAGDMLYLQDAGGLAATAGTVSTPVAVALSATQITVLLIGGGGSGSATSPLTMKGDLWGFDTGDARLPVGTDGQVLTADSAAALGVSYQTPATGGGPLVIDARTGTAETLALANAEGMVTLDNASAITLTVPPNSSVAFPVGTTIALAQLGAGQVTVAAGAGVTIQSYSSLLSIAAQNLPVSLTKLATDTWLLTGALA